MPSIGAGTEEVLKKNFNSGDKSQESALSGHMEERVKGYLESKI